ncbi:gametocyte-specific factor 1 homolog [Toxorhynchites rutilus septentrionalis]|uniref:gametocyte-specific factor 1 homolog n=1 Tax=Toxorhynchites rutilus septentrionalis TaxID=329112 RepID=UPI00247AA1D1|nr:gametocyte-specific factor 1 homolog [Toxorhynchites rutilus septentrionalis]
MDQLQGSGYDDVIECPYEKSHQIRKSRMQTHITKCKKNHKDLNYMKCPFNEIHFVPKKDLEVHKRECPDRGLFERYKYDISTPAPIQHTKNVITPEESYAPVSDDECWDSYDDKPYDPSEQIKNRNVIRKCMGKTPSEKKAFKEAERLRLQEHRNMDL